MIPNKKNDQHMVTAPAANMEEKQPVVARVLTVGQLADELSVPASEIIVYLLRQKLACSRNQQLPEALVAEVARHFGFEVVKAAPVQQPTQTSVALPVQGDQHKRAPVVVVVGHVDHGKTTLLDFIRKTRVAAREKGGITQHLGAYKVPAAHGDIIFLDTPGHEAFMRMRSRGIGVADIAIVVVAADDGIMPQTLESINAARNAGVSMIVALNKIDKVDQTRIDIVKQQLAKHGLALEEWGGDVICVPISAKEGRGVDKLLDMINLQADMLELKARLQGPGEGVVLETKLEKGRGVVATVLLRHGRAQVGDYFVVGAVTGKINSMLDAQGVMVRQVGPSDPVQIAGFDSVPQVGEVLRVVTAAAYKEAQRGLSAQSSPVSTDMAAEGAVSVILKADTESSKEALLSAIDKLAAQEKKIVTIVQAGVGLITESDIELAATTHARVYGFGVKPSADVQTLAKRYGVALTSFYVIYHLLDDLKAYLQSLDKPEMVLKKVGEAVVRKVFDIKGTIVAGCYVKSGKIVRDGTVVVLRGRNKIGGGDVRTLQRDRRTMKEVATGYECAFVVDGFSDFQVDDLIECFVQEAVEQAT